MNQLSIPDKLYGREWHINMLLESFERISSGNGQVLLVPGSSGVGKTALVQELKVPIKGRNGFFIRGKFEQYQQNIPYFAFRQALTELCRNLQAENEHETVRFKENILQSIGNLGQVLIDLVPELELFIGPQPPLGDISPQEARHRFAEVFRNFLKVICKPEHPLVLFIDDWQWADVASCELLRQLQVGISLRYMLVIVSYRDNEVGSGHPLMTAVNDLRSHDFSVEVLQVNNITIKDVQAIVADTLMPAIENIEELAAIIHGKTLGNPFFVRSFFSFLYEFNMIWLDNPGSLWKWNIHQTGGMDLPQSVTELFVLRLRQLDAESQDLFSLAACLGNRFDLETLSIISGHSPQECQSLLFSGPAKTLLLPFNYDRNNHHPEGYAVMGECTFLHDKVQKAAYTLIEPAELPDILLKIGRLLLAKLNPDQLHDRLFEVMNDLNAGKHLIQEHAEKVKMIELNMTAARKAYHSAAYSSALQFYRAAHYFLENPGFNQQLWIDRHKLTLNLFLGLAECEFLEGDRNEAEKCIKESVAHSKTALEKAQALNILIIQYTLLAKYPQAIESGLQALAALGVSLPLDRYEEARDIEIALVRQELDNRLLSSLTELPVMTNPEMLMVSKILITMGPPCYRSHQRLWSVIVPKVVNLTLRYGNIPQLGYSHTAFGGLLGWVDNDYSTAKKFGELATHLMTHRFRSPSDQSVFYLMIGSSVRHWFKHLSYGTQDYKDAYETGLRSGNLQYAAYAFGHNMYCRFYQGVPLPGLMEETRHSLDFSKTRGNQWAIDLLEGGLNIFGLLSEKEGFHLVDNRNWSENEFLQRVSDHHNIQVLCIYKVLKTFSLLVSGNYEDALLLSDQTEPLIYTVGTQGLLPWPEHILARILILTALYSKANENQQTKWHTELEQMINRLRIWAENGPDNFEHKYLLALAEMARIEGRSLEAVELYDKAIKTTQTNHFIQWEGMANERAYHFWIESGNERLADGYWQQAYLCYNRWGALAKVHSMEISYRNLIAQNIPENKGPGKLDEKQVQEIKNNLVEKQVKKLRDYAFQMQQTRLRIKAERKAGELADATKRLREEIAERKRYEDALRESEDRFKKLFMEAPLGIALIDSLTGQIYDVNPMFAKIAGKKMNEIAHLDWMSMTHPEDIQAGLDNMKLLNSGKTPGFQMEKRYLQHDGNSVWINMTVAPVYVEDKLQPRHLCMIEDISERKQTQEQLRLQNEELQNLNIEKDKFFSIIAHDLRSPFNSFLGLTHIMAEDLHSLPITEVQDIAVSMSKSASNFYRLLENLLNWAQMQQGLIPFNPAVFKLHQWVDESLETIQESARNKGIEITNDIPDGIEVFADLNMFQTVIRNLVSNAIKFTPKGGKVILSSKVTKENNCMIAIQDTGIGMNQTMVDNLFRIDVKSNRSGTEGEPSSGLGLLLCKEFIEKNGGEICVESEVGKGSVFYFTLPT